MRMDDGPDVGPSAHHHGVQRRLGAGLPAPIHNLAPVIDDDDVGGRYGGIRNPARRYGDEPRLRITDAHVARGPVYDAARQCFQSHLNHLLPQTLEQHSALYSVSVSRYWLRQTRCEPLRWDRSLARPQALQPLAGVLPASRVRRQRRIRWPPGTLAASRRDADSRPRA